MPVMTQVNENEFTIILTDAEVSALKKQAQRKRIRYIKFVLERIKPTLDKMLKEVFS